MSNLKVIPVERAVWVCEKAVRETHGVSPREEQLMSLLVASCPVFEYESTSFCRSEDLRAFILNLQKAIETNDSSFLLQKRGYCVEHIVDLEEFLESSEYMNQKGHIRPLVKNGLDRLFKGEQYVEAVLSGSIGWGKNYLADMAIARMLYLLSVLHNPQLEYGLAPGSSIMFVMQSKSLTLAKKVVFEQFAARLRLSPYFQRFFQFDPKVKSELRFPKGIYVHPIGGSDTGAIGMNVWGGIIDEMNFMARTADSIHVKHTIEEEYDQAEHLYTALIRRMTSRFMQKGKLPGKLLLVSSVNYPGDFTDRKIEEAKTNPTIFVMKHAIWDVLPKDMYSGEKFLLEVGNEVKSSVIVQSREEAHDSEDVIEVPIEYKSDFERDVEGALRDHAGLATGTKHPFIPYKELIQKAMDDYDILYEHKQLFSMQEVVLSEFLDPNAPEWELLIDLEYLQKHLLAKTTIHTVHIDVGVTNDACGVALGHISGYKLLPAVKIFNERSGEFTEVRDARAPIYTVDGVLRILAPRGGEVDLEMVRDMILWLRGRMFIKWATMDSYQSTMLIQGFRKGSIRSGVLSIDASLAPYTELKQAIKDERLLIPVHEVVGRELRELERDPKKGKIDHPQGGSGSKDCSDACAGVVYMLQLKEANYGKSGGRRGRKGSVSKTKRVRHVRVGRRRLMRVV